MQFTLLFAVGVLGITLANAGQHFIDTAHCNPLLGVSYPVNNVVSTTDLETMTSDAREIIWVKRIMLGADQENVFSDNMIGGEGSGKPFIRVDDLSKVDGNKIIITNMAPLGGPGTQGDGTRSGQEEKIRIGSFYVKIGRQWYGVGITDVAKEETVIGAQYDNVINKLLRERLGKKKTEDMLMELKRSATASNIVRPNNKATRELLKTADTVGTTTIKKAGVVCSSNGARPMKTETTEVGSTLEMFLFFGHQHGLYSLGSESAYLQAQQNAGVRGAKNPLFKGDFSNWDGHGIYRWLLRDHDAYGPVGSTLLPRAFLGTAIVTGTAAVDITGGGSSASAALLPAPRYFEFFSNALYTFTNGQTEPPGSLGNNGTADTATIRYVLIMNLTGSDAGKVGFYSYKVNTGNKLTMFKRLGAANSGDQLITVGNVVYDTAPWPAAGSGAFAGLSDAHPSGSLILETNSYGVPFCGSLMLGEMAGVCGHGSLRGRKAMGARTSEINNHGMDIAVGIETVYGSAAFKRTDGKTPNYVYIESAYQVDGLPTIT